MLLDYSQKIKVLITVVVIGVSSFFLFYHLGYYALWDDEADTALFAQSVWRTGDTSAMLDHNLIAHTYGQELKGLRNRYIPPLAFYLAAPFIGLSWEQGSAFAARLPFAICGLLTVAMMLFWLWRSGASVSMWLLTATGILGNVSLMLYSRQCRYYAPAILLTTVLAFLYVYRDGCKRTLFMMAFVLFLLFASHYMAYVAVLVCLTVDYFFWGRKVRPFRYSELTMIVMSQIVFGGLLISVYSLLGNKVVSGYAPGLWLKDKANLFFWNLRDLNACEMGVGIFLFIAPLFYLLKRDQRLIRIPLAVFIYVFIVVLLSPEPLRGFNLVNVRYLAPVIPFCIFIAVLSIQALTYRQKWLAVPLAILAFGTNVLHGGPLTGKDPINYFGRPVAERSFRSTVAEFVGELISPQPSAYRATANWINQNLKDKETVWIVPTYMTYPLMYHAPKVTYAWQLRKESEQFSALPDIHFEGRVPPEYVITFGPRTGDHGGASLDRLQEKGFHYTPVEQLDIYWYDLIRPELFWHSFREIKNYSPEEIINIFKLDH